MRIRTLLIAASLVFAFAVMAPAQVGPPHPNAIWADGQLYATVATPTNLPDHGPKDGLFMFVDVPGQRSVSESKPGDQDYNGGRWAVYQVTLVEGESLDHELTSWEEVQGYIDSGVLEIIGTASLVCPLIKQ